LKSPPIRPGEGARSRGGPSCACMSALSAATHARTHATSRGPSPPRLRPLCRAAPCGAIGARRMTCHGAFNGCCAALPPSSRVETAVQTITGATASLALPQRRAKVACQFTS
jgi:hypothetical protein